jgi:hypothetical protein
VRDVPLLVIRTPRFSPKCAPDLADALSLAPDSYHVSKTKIVYWQISASLRRTVISTLWRKWVVYCFLDPAFRWRPRCELGRKVQEGSVAAGRPLWKVEPWGLL